MSPVPAPGQLPMDQMGANICRAEGGFAFFVQQFWGEIIAEPLVWNWHLDYLCSRLEAVARRVALVSRGVDADGKPLPPCRLPAEFDYLIINVPPGSSKSTIVSIMYPVWTWTIDATQRFICTSYADTIAMDIADRCRKVFLSDKYKRWFPENRIDPDNTAKSDFKNIKSGERYATSTGASITGVHAHQIIVDDPMDPAKSRSEAERTTANNYIDQTLSTRKVDKEVTVTIVVMQRLHELDTTGHLLQKAGIRVEHICLPAERSRNVKPAHLAKYYQDGLLDPKRLSRTAIIGLKAQLGSYGASGQLQQTPSPDEGGILKKAWFEVVDRDIPKGARVKFKLDTAYTEKQQNDPSGFSAYFVERGITYIINMESQRLELPALCAYVPKYCARHGYSPRSTIKVEPKASGKSVVQVLKSNRKLNILEDKTPKDDKVTRANAAAPSCEAGKVKLLKGAWNGEFLDQIAAFPNGAHDEYVDLLSSIVDEEYVSNRDDYKFKRKN